MNRQKASARYSSMHSLKRNDDATREMRAGQLWHGVKVREVEARKGDIVAVWFRGRKTKDVCLCFFLSFFWSILISHQKFVLFVKKLSKNSQCWVCLACNFPLYRNLCVWGFHQGASLVNQPSLLKEKGTECYQAYLMPETTHRHHLLLFGEWGEQCVLL